VRYWAKPLDGTTDQKSEHRFFQNMQSSYDKEE
jgi:hypothetical protein